ncbi:MAG: hypothetical protein R2991_10765 [Thermoanaerobaculia bacterium]
MLDERLDRGSEVMVATFEGSIDVALAPTRDRKLQEVLTRSCCVRLASLGDPSRGLGHPAQVRETLVYHVEDLVRASFAAGEIMDLACTSTSNVVKLAEQEMARIRGTAQASRSSSSHHRLSGPQDNAARLRRILDGGRRAAHAVPDLALRRLLHFQGLRATRFLARATPSKYFAASAQLEMEQWDTVDLWRSVVARANAERVTLYTMQALGLTAPAAAGVDAVQATSMPELIGHADTQAALVEMAEGTGGRAMLNANDYTADIAQMLDERTQRYELAFYPQGAIDEEIHSLRLEVGRPGVELRYRESYQRRTASERSAGGVLAALYHGREENPHHLHVKVEPREGDDTKTVEVDVELRIALADLVLVPQGGGSKGLVTVYASARDQSGATLPVGERRIPLTVAPDDAGGDFRYVVRMPLPRRRDWTVAVAVRDELGDRTSYVTTPVHLLE